MEILEKYRKYVDLVELRVDFLDPDERFHIRRFPEMAGFPVILTIRRGIEGGHSAGGEGARITLLAKGLAYAVADKRRNFAYVELEGDLEVPSLEEAARAFGTRIIRSWHNMEGVGEDLAGKIKKLRRVGDELVKVTVMPKSLDDVTKVYRAAKETVDVDKIILCMGEYSANTRILAEVLGSRFSYTSPGGEDELMQAGQLDPKVMTELYRFREINADTMIFGVSGYPLKVTESPRVFNPAFSMEHINAVYVPIPADSIRSLVGLADEIGILGISITVPYKEDILPYLAHKSSEVNSIGACNTILREPHGWVGYNTDTAGFSDSLLTFMGSYMNIKDFRRRKITIVGAGGSAKAVASEVHRLRGKALILNRTMARARSLAEPYRFKWAGFDGRGAELIEKYSDIIIQTTSAGMEPNVDEDPLGFYKFSGKETVMDLIYKPEKTVCLKRAEKAGCRIINGSDMLFRQARIQYSYFVNREFPISLMSKIKL